MVVATRSSPWPINTSNENTSEEEPLIQSEKTSLSVDMVVPYKELLLNRRMIVTILVNMHAASCWSALDPILEPELRRKVRNNN